MTDFARGNRRRRQCRNEQVIAVPNQAAIDEFVDFEDGQLPPAGWVEVTSAGGEAAPPCRSTPPPPIPGRGDCSASMTPRPRPARSAPVSSTRCRRAASNGERRVGSIRRVWSWATGQVAVSALSPQRQPVECRGAHSQRRAGASSGPRGQEMRTTRCERRDGPAIIALGRWRKWRLELVRLATRETTAILYLDDGARMSEQVRLNWDSTAHDPTSAARRYRILVVGRRCDDPGR